MKNYVQKLQIYILKKIKIYVQNLQIYILFLYVSDICNIFYIYYFIFQNLKYMCNIFLYIYSKNKNLCSKLAFWDIFVTTDFIGCCNSK